MICEVCGKVCTRVTPAQRYCGECASTKHKEADARKILNYRIRCGVKVGVGKGGNNRKGVDGYTYSNGVGIFRRLKLDSMSNRLCERCGKDLTTYIETGGRNSMWVVHHKDANYYHNVLSNLELLCKRCHQLHHDCTRNLPS